MQGAKTTHDLKLLMTDAVNEEEVEEETEGVS